MFDVKGKKVTIIGAARSGIAAANLLGALKAKVKISDARNATDLEPQLALLKNRAHVTLETSAHTQAFIEDSDLVVVSPGVPYEAKPLQWARAKHREIISEIELAYRLCPCPIIAITGTNGKTTTVNLIAQILRKANKQVCLCGNIGEPFSSFVLNLTPKHIVVLEISSFQLQTTSTFRPKVALWTNFSQNHLDQHKDINEYFQAKCKLFANQDVNDITVLNAKQPEHIEIAKTLKSRVDFFNAADDPKDIDNPNFLAALHAVRAVGITDDIARQVFAEFKGVEHRLEFVRALDGVDYINDSKSTTLEAGRWALERMRKPIVLICGGSDKHLDYTPLRDLVKHKVKHMVALGQTKEQMQRTFSDLIPLDVVNSFQEGVNHAKAVARPGDCVLLSPMCASFDMFKNYEHRGAIFKEMVRAL